MGEDKIPCFDGLVAWKARFLHHLDCRFAVFKLSETPTAHRGVQSGFSPKVLKVYQRRSTSITAWAKACGASCGMLWPTPPVMSR